MKERTKEDAMKRSFINSTAILMTGAANAFAGSGTSEQGGWLWTLFIGFGALIIVFQLIPATVLFGSMLKGLFSATAKKAAMAAADSTERKP
jgi:hypothetical protein